MKRSGKRIAIVCNVCASRDVSRDAWADWDSASQQWVLRAVFDYAFCHACEQERSLKDVPLADEPEVIRI